MLKNINHNISKIDISMYVTHTHARASARAHAHTHTHTHIHNTHILHKHTDKGLLKKGHLLIGLNISLFDFLVI